MKRIICTEDMKRAGLLREHKRLEENDAFSDRVSVVLETRRFQSFGVGFFLMWCSLRVRCDLAVARIHSKRDHKLCWGKVW